jgi:hypothetical protein
MFVDLIKKKKEKKRNKTSVFFFLKKLGVEKGFLLPIESNPNEFTIFFNILSN